MNKKIKIGVLGPSDIAQRRTIPAILNSKLFEYVGVAYASSVEWQRSGINGDSFVEIDKKKAEAIQCKFGGKVFDSYLSIILSDVDALYIPLPPGVHKLWALECIKNNKHVLLEKPLSTCEEDAKFILDKASEKNIVVHENYAFIYHKQISYLKELISSGNLGDARFINATFCFPYKGADNFRYHKNSGGGALLDCAGYPIKLVAEILGYNMSLVNHKNYSSKGHDIDVYGYALFQKGQCYALTSWGMDNSYKCDFEYVGSNGKVVLNRAYTPTADMPIQISVNVNNVQQDYVIEPCDQFLESVETFGRKIVNNLPNDNSSVLLSHIIDELKEN